MKYIQLSLGVVSTNCYILYNNKKEALIIDPGAQAEVIFDAIREYDVKPLAVLLTHAHFDHIGAVSECIKKYDIPFYIHKKEKYWLTDGNRNGSILFGVGDIAVPETPIIFTEDKMEIGSFHFQILHTPGHSPGSVSFYFENNSIVFAGDALFQMSIGRTDLPFGNQETLEKSIKEKLYTLPGKTVVAPGHGPVTNIEFEKNNNPFVLG